MFVGEDSISVSEICRPQAAQSRRSFAADGFDAKSKWWSPSADYVVSRGDAGESLSRNLHFNCKVSSSPARPLCAECAARRLLQDIRVATSTVNPAIPRRINAFRFSAAISVCFNRVASESANPRRASEKFIDLDSLVFARLRKAISKTLWPISCRCHSVVRRNFNRFGHAVIRLFIRLSAPMFCPPRTVGFARWRKTLMPILTVKTASRTQTARSNDEIVNDRRERCNLTRQQIFRQIVICFGLRANIRRHRWCVFKWIVGLSFS